MWYKTEEEGVIKEVWCQSVPGEENVLVDDQGERIPQKRRE